MFPKQGEAGALNTCLVAMLGASEAPNYLGEVKAEAQTLVNKTIEGALKDEARKERQSMGG